MTARASGTAAVPPWSLAAAAMLSVRLGPALSVHLISTAGPAGTSWLRLSIGALRDLISYQDDGKGCAVIADKVGKL